MIIYSITNPIFVNRGDDLFDCIIKHISSNDLYQLLLVDRNIKMNIKKTPIELKRLELQKELDDLNPYGRLAICEDCENNKEKMRSIRNHEANVKADNDWLTSAGWGEI